MSFSFTKSLHPALLLSIAYLCYCVEGAGYLTTQKEHDNAEKKAAECECNFLCPNLGRHC